MIKVDFIYIVILIFVAVFFCFLAQRSHLLGALFLLELMSLVLMVAYPIRIIGSGRSITILVVRFLTIRACEGRLGLRIFVIMVRKGGNDLLGGLSINSV